MNTTPVPPTPLLWRPEAQCGTLARINRPCSAPLLAFQPLLWSVLDVADAEVSDLGRDVLSDTRLYALLGPATLDS
jgi:hypothetical protein